MYKEHPCFKTPNDSTKIWRYINFSKLILLLEHSSLFFPSAQILAENDPYEGSYARGNLEYDPIKDPSFDKLDPKVKAAIQAARKQGRQFTKEKLRKGIYINSWYINEYDSAAMWKCYAEHEDGIAIQSTVSKLKAAVKACPTDIYIGDISYIDYETFTIPEHNIFFNFLYKRKSFEHERELRALCMDIKLFELPATPPSGVAISIDTKTLIERIFISPTAPDWIKELVETITVKYGLGKIVQKSSLYEKGLW